MAHIIEFPKPSRLPIDLPHKAGKLIEFHESAQPDEFFDAEYLGVSFPEGYSPDGNGAA